MNMKGSITSKRLSLTYLCCRQRLSSAEYAGSLACYRAVMQAA